MNSIEFEQVTITYRRRQAANQIALFYRSKKALSEITQAMRKTFLQYLNNSACFQILEKLQILEQQYQNKSRQLKEKKEKLNAKKFRTQSNENFNDTLKSLLLHQNYHQIPFDFPDFIPHVFGALEQNIINKNQLLTIVLLHDALDFFRVSPSELQAYYLFEGPFHPQQMHYWLDKHQNTLLEMKHEFYTYYALPLNELFIERLIYEMIDDDFQEPYFQSLLKLIFKRKNILGNKLISDYFAAVNEKPKLALLNTLFPDGPPMVDQTTIDSIRFLIAIEQLSHQMPSIKVIEDKVYFIIPSIDTFNLLTGILFTEEQILPYPVIGRFSPRFIRACDEIPSIPKGQEKTPAQQHLARLFPITKTLGSPHRPVEIYYPGISYEKKPHGFLSHPFMLTWHDLFHTWRASENEKNFIRKLRELHDHKLNYNPHPEKAMSEAIWKLTDMDCSAGMTYHEKYQHHQIQAFTQLIKNLVFNYEFPQIPENYLFLFHYITNPSYWEPLPYIGSIKFLSRLSYIWNDVDFKKIFFRKYQDVEQYLQIRPQAPWMQIYWYSNLNPQLPFEKQLIETLDEENCQKLFTWPGIEIEFNDDIYQNHLQALHIHKTVLNNQKSHLYFAFMLTYLQRHHGLHELPLGPMICFLHQFNIKWVEKLLLNAIKGLHLLNLYEVCPKTYPLYTLFEYLLIQSTDSFQQYLKIYRKELSHTWIETCAQWSIEQRKHVFYNKVDEPYYLIQYQQIMPKDHLLSLSRTYPKWARRLKELLQSQELTSKENERYISESPCTTDDSSVFSQKTF